MNDGVVAVRVFTLLVSMWPVFAAVLVYLAQRSSISRSGVYWLKSLGYSYLASLLGPVVMVIVFMVFGVVAELALIYTIFLGIPVFAFLPVLIAVRASKTS